MIPGLCEGGVLTHPCILAGWRTQQLHCTCTATLPGPSPEPLEPHSCASCDTLVTSVQPAEFSATRTPSPPAVLLTAQSVLSGEPGLALLPFDSPSPPLPLLAWLPGVPSWSSFLAPSSAVLG